jgi:hypothetical protein
MGEFLLRWTPLEPGLHHWITQEVLIREYILLRPNSVAEYVKLSGENENEIIYNIGFKQT